MERGYWIKSKPEYGVLKWQEPTVSHVVIAYGDGGRAVLRLFQQTPKEEVHLFFADSASAEHNYADIICPLVPEQGLHISDSKQKLLAVLEQRCAEMLMSTRFYIAGDEGFIWSALAVLRQYGVQEVNVEKEVCGTLARSVYCVHCKTIDHDVHHNIHQCSGCDRYLFVRDHFSRRLGAYMGVMVDAEEPGKVPVAEEVYV